ncbi:MAG: glycosyltransferase family 2 protein [Patescibacteria group bacterium]
MSNKKVTIQIVSWNGMRYLPHCLHSIFEQTCKDFQVLMVDNNSRDESVSFVRKNYPEVAVLQNNRNLNFAKANNQGIKLLHTPYLVLCNQDIVLESDWLEKMLAIAESEKYRQFGSFGGKLLRLKMPEGEAPELNKTEIIDSCGLKVLKSHRVVELGGGEPSSGFVENSEVFGQSGALVLYRRAALDDSLLQGPDHGSGDYFDSDFSFYKEDVDLAWRLQLLGWPSLFVASAIAYHARTFAGSEKKKIIEVIKNRRSQSKLARFNSYRNHFFVLLTDDFLSNLLIFSPQIFWYELRKFLYLLFMETASLRALFGLLAAWPKISRKRKQIFSRVAVDAKYIRSWFK